MNDLLASVALNAAITAVLAGLVWTLGRYVRRPALIHALWVLVLVKLVTPPVVSVSVPVPAVVAGWFGAEEKPIPSAELLAPAVRSDGRPTTLDASAAAPGPAATGRAETTGTSSSIVEGPSAVRSVPEDQPRTDGFGRFCARWAWLALVVVWAAGGLCWWGVNLRALLRFRRGLGAWGRDCPELGERARDLAAKLGLGKLPVVQAVDAPVAPMLWGCGRWARIVLPLRLVERLDPAMRDTLLIHELAHFKRGDHWVRLLELVATGLYWWNPVVWFARWRISVLEEACCDAWVVSQLSGSRRRYAEALLETLDFISERRPAVVPFASAVGELPAIEERLRDIMQGTTPRSLSSFARWGVVAAAALLPLQPIFCALPAAHARQQAARPDPLLDLLPGTESTVDGTDVAISAARGADAGAADAQTLILPPPTRHPLLETGPARQDWATAASPGGRFELTAWSGDRVRLRDRDTGGVVELAEGAVTAAVFTHDDRLLVGAKNGDVRWYDAATGTPVSFLGRHRAEVSSVAVTADGRLAVTGGRDGTVFVWDLQAGGAIKRDWNMREPVSAVRCSPDGRRVAVAAGDWRGSRGAVALYDLATGELVSELAVDAPIGALQFASNSRSLLTATWDGRVTVWDLDTGLAVGHDQVTKDAVSAASFSQDNAALAALLAVGLERPVGGTATPRGR